MLYGLSTGFFSTDFSFDPQEMMPRIAKCGYDFAHVSLDTAFVKKGKAWWSELKKICDDCNIIFDPGMGLGPDMDVSSDDPVVRQKGIDYLLALIEAVQFMGGHRLEGIHFVGLGAFDGEIDRKKRWENSVESVPVIMKACEQADIRFGMELCNRNEQFLMNTIEDGVRFCEDVGSPNLGFCLDVYHMAIEEDSFYDAIVLSGARTHDFHACEPNRKAPIGKGLAPWEDIRRGLRKIGYDGYVALEPFARTGGGRMKGTRIWRDLQEDVSDAGLDAMAVRSLAWVKQLLEG